MDKELVIGGVVVFIDQHRAEQNALITAIHGDPQGRVMMPRRTPASDSDGTGRLYDYETDENGNHVYDYGEPGAQWPCVNLVLVTPTHACKDQYGRQLERHCSVVHQAQNSAQGYCYRFIDEVIDPMLRQPTVT
jgi:hypothetical protein